MQTTRSAELGGQPMPASWLTEGELPPPARGYEDTEDIKAQRTQVRDSGDG